MSFGSSSDSPVSTHSRLFRDVRDALQQATAFNANVKLWLDLNTIENDGTLSSEKMLLSKTSIDLYDKQVQELRHSLSLHAKPTEGSQDLTVIQAHSSSPAPKESIALLPTLVTPSTTKRKAMGDPHVPVQPGSPPPRPHPLDNISAASGNKNVVILLDVDEDENSTSTLSSESIENPFNDDLTSQRKRAKRNLSQSNMLRNEASENVFGVSSVSRPFIWKSTGKFNESDLVMKTSSFRRRLDTLGHYPLGTKLERNLQVRYFHVSREFMSAEYGGSQCGLLPPIAHRKVLEHGYDDFMYPTFWVNPYLPQCPGEPGLFFRTDDGTNIWENNLHCWENRRPIQRVLVRENAELHRYVGQYKLIRMEDLSKEEWSAQSQIVKRTWICKKSLERPHMWPLLARVYLRNIKNREPSAEEVTEQLRDKGCKLIDLVTSEDVHSAFENGQEHLAVWGMKCVSYDHDFLRQLVKKYPRWLQDRERSGKTRREGLATKKADDAFNESDATFELSSDESE